MYLRRRVGALDEHRLVADRLLLLVDRGDVVAHAFGADLHVAHGMIGVGLGVALPHLDGVGHQLAHGRLEIIVADDAAGDARGACRDRRLVDHEDVGARAPAGRFQHLREMEGRAEAVNAGPDDGVFGGLRDAHRRTPSPEDWSGFGPYPWTQSTK